jgi:hypothetical protein
MAWNFPD